ncbi:MAG: endonuclease/exonuclease/phosphatase family protein [Myxococcota bacterium]
MRITTWNLNGLDDDLLDERTEAACLRVLLRPDAPDVVLLQEVVRRSWHGHLRHHFAAAGYRAIPPDPTQSSHEYFVVLFVRNTWTIHEATFEPLPRTVMGRGVLAVEVSKGPDAPRIWIATAHLESGKDVSDVRVQQLRHALTRMGERPGPAVFGGDLNLRVAEERKVPELAHVTDAFEAAGSPAADRVTWPSSPRPWQTSKGGGARFDRIYLQQMRLDRFARIGERPGPGIEALPSDHVGLEVDVTPEGAGG